MNILFIHQNLPGQFKFLAPALAADPAHTVVAMTMQKVNTAEWQGIRLVPLTQPAVRSVYNPIMT